MFHFLKLITAFYKELTEMWYIHSFCLKMLSIFVLAFTSTVTLITMSKISALNYTSKESTERIILWGIIQKSVRYNDEINEAFYDD